MTSQTELAVLRTMDKYDKIGADGVCDLLQKPFEEFGAGLDPVRAALISQVLLAKGATNDETLLNLRQWFSRAPVVMNRLSLLAVLEAGGEDGSETALDRLLAMEPNADQTWTSGGRPANIGWALDDLIANLATP